MPISGFQIERIINRLRRWRGLMEMVQRRLRAAPERVELSEAGNVLSRQRVDTIDPRLEGYLPDEPPRHWPAELGDPTPYPEPVLYELERRAGSFMNPKYDPLPSPATIPKIKRNAGGS